MGTLVTRAVSQQWDLTALAQDMFLMLHVAIEAVLTTGDVQAMGRLISMGEGEGSRMPVAVRAQLHRLRAHLASRGRSPPPRPTCGRPIEDALAWASPVLAARCQGELGTLLVRAGPGQDAEPYLAAARATYERLGAVAWLRDLEDASVGQGVVT